jgi:branched-chain amino acid transport system permease protein
MTLALQAADATPLVDVVVDMLELGSATRIVVDSLSKAALYITIAAGLSLVFGLMGVLNFAHGSFAVYGAYLGGVVMVVLVTASAGGLTRLLVFFLALAFVFALMTALGSAVERTLVRPIYDREPLFQILLTFGLVLVMDEAARIAVDFRGITPLSTWRAPLDTLPAFLDSTAGVGGSTLRVLWFFEILVGAVVVAATWLFLTRTRYGLYIRAGSEDGEMAQALGIDVRRAFTLVFGVGSGLAAAAGVVLMWDSRFGASVPLSVETLLIAFVVVIIGGLGSFKGTVVAGVLVGVIDGVATWLFEAHSAVSVAGLFSVPISAELPQLVMFLALVGVLVVRPLGLFGVAEVGGH